jgi:hypothetical protein
LKETLLSVNEISDHPHQVGNGGVTSLKKTTQFPVLIDEEMIGNGRLIFGNFPDRSSLIREDGETGKPNVASVDRWENNLKTEIALRLTTAIASDNAHGNCRSLGLLHLGELRHTAELKTGHEIEVLLDKSQRFQILRKED